MKKYQEPLTDKIQRLMQGLPPLPGEPMSKPASPPAAVPATPDPEKKERRGLDPELQVAATCNRALATLPPAAQARVLRWLADRHTHVLAAPIDNGVKVLPPPGDPSYRTNNATMSAKLQKEEHPS